MTWEVLMVYYIKTGVQRGEQPWDWEDKCVHGNVR